MMKIIDRIKNTREYDIIREMEKVYQDIEKKQAAWKKAGNVVCPDGCGQCCVNFEPDVLESEALYLAAWLLEHDEQKADAIAEERFIPLRANTDTGCFLFDYDSPWHCTVYEGRCLICRLFGYSGDRGKDGKKRWKPCRFYPAEQLDAHVPPLTHRQYTEGEMQDLFGCVPPAMSDCMEQALSLTPESSEDTHPLRQALPAAIRKLKLIIAFNSSDDDNSGGEPMSA